jgi:hypothetical protein
MIKRINNYLLTHYPLLWNTRVVWILAAAICFHLLFMLGGFATTTAESLRFHYGLRSVGGGELMTFSVLISIGLLICWLIYYLRNNAFKSFYILEPFHTAKEFGLQVIIILFCITLFDSFHQGVAIKTKMITSEKEWREEATVLNIAAALIPQEKANYFKLRQCDQNSDGNRYSENVNYFDTSAHDYDSTYFKNIRKALQEPDAFTYLNYCFPTVYPDLDSNYNNWFGRKNSWIISGQKDSIGYILDRGIALCKKYNIEQRINKTEIIDLIFKDSLHSVTRTFNLRRYSDVGDESEIYFDRYSFSRVLDFVDDAHSFSSRTDAIKIELYIALCFAILLLCYRIFSKKVFLISILGTIVWSIIFALFGMSSNGEGISGFYVILFLVFLTLTLAMLAVKRNKVVTGVLLSWHMFMLPFLILVLMTLIQNAYLNDLSYNYYPYYRDDSIAQKDHPIGYWVYYHRELLWWLNLPVVFLYTSIVFTRLGKKWHIMPEE